MYEVGCACLLFLLCTDCPPVSGFGAWLVGLTRDGCEVWDGDVRRDGCESVMRAWDEIDDF